MYDYMSNKLNLLSEAARLYELSDEDKLGTLHYHISSICDNIRDRINDYCVLELLNFLRDCRILEADCKAILDVEKTFLIPRPVYEHLKKFEKKYNIRLDENDIESIDDVITYCNLEEEYKLLVVEEIEEINFARYQEFVDFNDDGDYIFKEA